VLSFSFVSSALNKSQTASFIPIKWLKRKEENEKRKKIAGHDVKYQKFNGNLNIPTDSKGGNSKTKSQTFFFLTSPPLRVSSGVNKSGNTKEFVCFLLSLFFAIIFPAAVFKIKKKEIII
jgi:hypothetical protein